MSLRLRVCALALSALAFGSLGCLDVETVFTIYPDGSGRVCNTMTVDQSALESMRGMMPTEPGQESPVQQEIKGLVGGQKLRISSEGMFDDVNKVEIQGIKLRFEKGPDGIAVRAAIDPAAGKAAAGGMGGMGGMFGGPGGKTPPKPDEGENLTDDPEEERSDPDDTGDSSQPMAAQMLSGISMKVRVVLPCAVTTTTGQADGRRATLAIDPAKLSKASEPVVFEARCADQMCAEAQAEHAELQAALRQARERAAEESDEDR